MKNRPEKTVMIAELKAQQGTLTSRLPARAWGSTKLPPPLGRGVDSLAALADERQSER